MSDTARLIPPILHYDRTAEALTRAVLDLIPPKTKLLVEPFCGSAGVGVNWPGPKLLADVDMDAVSVLLGCQSQPGELCGEIERIGALDSINYTKWLESALQRHQRWLECQCSATIGDIVDAIYLNDSRRNVEELCALIQETSSCLQNATFFVGDYREEMVRHERAGKNIVIYCNPPCMATTLEGYEWVYPWPLRNHVDLASRSLRLSGYFGKTVIVAVDEAETALPVYGEADEIYRVRLDDLNASRVFVFRPKQPPW